MGCRFNENWSSIRNLLTGRVYWIRGCLMKDGVGVERFID